MYIPSNFTELFNKEVTLNITVLAKNEINISSNASILVKVLGYDNLKFLNAGNFTLNNASIGIAI